MTIIMPMKNPNQPGTRVMFKMLSCRHWILLGVTLLVIGVFLLPLKHSPVISLAPRATYNVQEHSGNVTKYVTHEYKSQRDLLSKLLNEMKKAYGQQSCNVKVLQKKNGEKVDPRISQNGGWCAETSGSNSSAHMFDKGFAKALSAFLKGKHVGSFGDGPGDYKEFIEGLKEVISYSAFDGAPYCEVTTQGRVQFLDLSAPQYGMNSFDWVISVEVGEHIPRPYEDIYLDNLVRHAKEGIVLSWAVPGQDGLSHVNNRPLSHVVAQMEKRGFEIDEEGGRPLREGASRIWLRQNLQIYKRTNLSLFRPDLA